MAKIRLRGWIFVYLVWVAVGFHAPCSAQQVNDPIPITHEVNLQLIQVTTTDGSEVATVFDNKTADVSQRVNQIWAQCGIQVNLLPDVNVYANNFAFDGRPSDFSTNNRPTSHLGTILSRGDSAGAGNSDREVIDAYFVDILPGFSRLGNNFVAGLARVDANGMTMLVSDSLLRFDNGLAVVSSVFAHEIGHNLGLDHLPADTANLMASSGGTAQLTASQCNEVFDDRRFSIDGADLLQELDFAPCDFDGDGRCDIADLDSLYEARNTSNSTFELDNTDGLNLVNQADIAAWLREASDVDNPAKLDPTDVYVAGDLNLDGNVDSDDLGAMLNLFGESGFGWASGNLNTDDIIDSDDLGQLLNQFGHQSVAASSANVVPEPSAGLILGMMLVILSACARSRRT